MAFQTPLTINEAIENIESNKYLLPAIQREFVWSPDQITKLFDSLMRDYPINAFLFWKVARENINEFRFYEFLRDYHQRNKRHNEKINLNGNEDIIAVLDGQQRLTSLFIGLNGSYASKIPYRRYDDPQAYPKKELYLNLLSKSDDPDYEYEFEFLTEDEASSSDHDHHWFLIRKIRRLKEPGPLNEYLIDNNLINILDKDKAKFAMGTLFKLQTVIHTTPSISYYLEQSKELDKVLNIFIRINSGGTILSYSDLLLSFAITQWEKRDAREEINSFVDEINGIGRGFNVNKDFVLKACLVLSDFNDISFKVDNFNKSNMLQIEKNWVNLTRAIRDAMRLISSFGFSRENITSNNLIIPIAYYLKHKGLPNNFETSDQNIKDRIKIKKWLTLSLLKRVFSFSPDGVLRPVREIIKNCTGEFPLDEIINYFKGKNRDLVFTSDDIDNLLNSKYGQGDNLVIMSIIYSWADLRNNFHIDHIFPKSSFTKVRLEKHGIPTPKTDYYLENYNYLGNLQLLESTPNIQKRDKEFDEWFNGKFTTDEEKNNYKDKHSIPKNIDLNLSNFEEFFDKRKKLISQKLKNELI